MSSARELHAALVALLTGTTVTVHNGRVPPDVAADGDGRVYPYVVVWGTAGRPSLERPVSGTATTLTWNPQVTVAAGDIDWLMGAVGVVRGRLEGARLTPWIQLKERTDTEVPVQWDPDASPGRFYLPLYYSTTA